MLIRRCAWHREFHGYALIHGVASWRGYSIKVTDGVCRRCAARVRVEWHLSRAQARSPFYLNRLLPAHHRRAALVAGLGLVVATVLPSGSITSARLGDVPGPSPEITDVSTPAAVAEPSREAEPPRVSHHRPASPEVMVIRYRTPVRSLRPSSGAPVPVWPHPVETRRIELAVQVAAAAPLVTSVSRVRAVEDELMRVARGHSITRLLLSPSEERPRHAGLMVQTP